MSTLVYSNLTTLREEETAGGRKDTGDKMKTYVDAVAGLVPAEVLALHALVISVTTETVEQSNEPVTKIIAPGTLIAAFIGLTVFSVVLYLVPRLGKLKPLDAARAAIPPVAFIAWSMLQKATAFDAVAPGLSEATRTVIGLGLAAVLVTAAVPLAKYRTQPAPRGQQEGAAAATV